MTIDPKLMADLIIECLILTLVEKFPESPQLRSEIKTTFEKKFMDLKLSLEKK